MARHYGGTTVQVVRRYEVGLDGGHLRYCTICGKALHQRPWLKVRSVDGQYSVAVCSVCDEAAGRRYIPAGRSSQ